MADEPPTPKAGLWLERKKQRRAEARANPKVHLNSAFPHVGVAIYYATPPATVAGRIERLAQLLTDARWPWLPWWASYTAVDKRNDRSSIRVGGKNGTAPLLDGMSSPTMRTLHMNRARGDGNFTTVLLSLLRAGNPGTAMSTWITCRSAELPPDKTFEDFIALTHDLVLALGSRHATIGAWPTFSHARCDTWQTRMILDTPKGDINLGLPSDFSEQLSLLSEWGFLLGETYARHPRWGTYLHPGHVAAIGGLDRLRAEVAPARLDAVGDLLYVQLTDSIDTAMSPLATEKRLALEGLMAPILLGAERPQPP